MSTHGQTKQTLGSGDYERLAEIALHLPPEKVEVLCRCGREGDMHVHVGGF